MGSYKLAIKPSAAKELEAVPRKDRVRVAHKLQALAGNPRPQGCERLAGHELYRIRQGDYRVLYEVVDRDHSITIYKIGHRREVYR